jgi:hypothetical protein
MIFPNVYLSLSIFLGTYYIDYNFFTEGFVYSGNY